MRISGVPEGGKATQRILLVSALAVMAASCSSQSARLGSNPDTMTTGSVSGVPQYQQMVPPENVGTGGYQALPSQNSAVVSRQPINTATTAGSGARMATTPVAVQSGNLPSPQPVQTAAMTQPANPSATYSQQQATVGAPSNLPSRTQDVATKRVMMRSDETLAAFAARNGASEQDILRLNGLTSPSQVRAGQVLLVPLVSSQSSAAKATAEAQGLPPAAPVPTPSNTPDQRVAVLPTTPSSREKQSTGASATSSASTGQSGDGRTPASGNVYTVKSGDSLYTIAKANGVTVDSLKAANGLTSSNIRIGQKLAIPTGGAAPAQPVTPVQTAEKPAPQQTQQKSAASGNPKPYQPPAAEEQEVVVQEVAVRSDAGEAVPEGTGIATYRWPVKGAVVVGFGQPDGDDLSEGIDISVPQGTPIKAAENGVVVYADDGLSDYGNAILIRHDDGRVTVYGYAEELKVKRGDSVQRGQTIATSGMTGKATRPMVHFEVRDNTKAVDPMPYLNG
ncbi:peptidoglycan DD-metalloendopeptidase family protein [Martelella radicis]|uniref:Murein DD-endopeptidase MepM/ murein hydrolase activator NlpD n=1 Tax=Martelella radicis TaxID=1397476 RepID=A0A7W6KH93_9HYPH|nr:peptidoglycan DD-metalloendopeptidase family protein [Martelella radicis]MBB4120184.1 murein DD-endopeptidase MepM/ murein hydrolase activator NlpD [Martelella radicis]